MICRSCEIICQKLDGAVSLAALGLDWEVAGFGPIHGPRTFDMVLRNVNPSRAY